MGSQTYKVAIIGTGFGAKVHAPSFIEHERFEVVGIAGRSEEKTARIAEDLEIEQWTTNWKDLLKMDVDVVSVSTPPYLHHKMGKKVLQAKKHLLLEKPTASNAIQAKELARLAEENSLVGMICHEFRFLPHFNFVRELIQAGKIGTVREFHAQEFFGFWADERLPAKGWLFDSMYDGGMLGALGSHVIDRTRYLISDEFKEIFGRPLKTIPTRTTSDGAFKEMTTDDGFQLIGSTIRGINVSIIASTTLHSPPPSRYVIGGSQGTIMIEGSTVFFSDGKETMKQLEIPEKFNLDIKLAEKDRRIPPFLKLLDRLAISLENKKSLSPNLQDAWYNQIVLDSVKTSYNLNSGLNTDPAFH